MAVKDQPFANLAKSTNAMIVPTNVADMASVTTILSRLFEFGKQSAK